MRKKGKFGTQSRCVLHGEAESNQLTILKGPIRTQAREGGTTMKTRKSEFFEAYELDNINNDATAYDMNSYHRGYMTGTEWY